MTETSSDDQAESLKFYVSHAALTSSPAAVFTAASSDDQSERVSVITF